ncbi:MAG: exosortase family protein XrtG [Lactobacillus sp.]|jgi:exosortase family protein XrtG|nr:MAG: exosortase family protein XrtG [Lactobacillus sp.]
MNVYIIVGTIIWLYVLSVLKRSKLSAFFFIVGSGGLFFILIALSDPYWVWFFTHAVLHGIGWLGGLTHMSTIMPKYGLVSISNPTSPVMMSIDYECSGIIETTAFISLAVFYPLFNKFEKVFFVLWGILWIYLANVIRLMTVITITHFGGGNLFFLAHSVIGRMVFYVLVIVLYYNVFTYSQISHSLYNNFKARMHGIRFRRE